MVKVHACMTSHLQGKLPWAFGREEKKQEILEDLGQEFFEVRTKFNYAAGDMPEYQAYLKYLKQANWDNFKPLNEKMMASADQALSDEIPALIARARYISEHPEEEVKQVEADEGPKQSKWF